MHRVWSLLIAIAIFVNCPCRSEAGLIINLIDTGGSAPTTTTGAGTLSSVVRAAADVWELAFNKWAFFHTLTLEYRWASKGGSTLASHSLLSQTGEIPYRETYGMLDFDNDDSSFFLDDTLDVSSLATLIASSSEYSNYSDSSSDLGGGPINVQRTFSGANVTASGHDLFTVALHEIGHALGMSSANSSYLSEASDGEIDVTGSMPFSGSVIEVSSAHVSISTALLFSSLGAGVRKLPSAVDILANAQLSQFTNPNLDLDVQPVPEPSSLLLASIIGGCGFAFRVRRCRDTAASKASAA